MSYWSGRAVSGLAARSALRKKCFAFLLGLALRATLFHPSAVWPSAI